MLCGAGQLGLRTSKRVPGVSRPACPDSSEPGSRSHLSFSCACSPPLPPLLFLLVRRHRRTLSEPARSLFPTLFSPALLPLSSLCQYASSPLPPSRPSVLSYPLSLCLPRLPLPVPQLPPPGVPTTCRRPNLRASQSSFTSNGHGLPYLPQLCRLLPLLLPLRHFPFVCLCSSTLPPVSSSHALALDHDYGILHFSIRPLSSLLCSCMPLISPFCGDRHMDYPHPLVSPSDLIPFPCDSDVLPCCRYSHIKAAPMASLLASLPWASTPHLLSCASTFSPLSSSTLPCSLSDDKLSHHAVVCPQGS